MGSKFLSGQNGKKCNVKQIITHPNWDRRTMAYDVALLRMDCSVKYTDQISPIPLPKSTDDLRTKGGVNVFVSGFGTLYGE